VAVEDQDSLHAVSFQTLGHVEDHVLKGFLAQAEGSLAIHPVLGDSDGDRGGHQHLRKKPKGRLLGHQGDAGRVVDHGQVLVVLLGGRGRDDDRLQGAALQALPELLARVLPKPDLAQIDVTPVGADNPGLGGQGGQRSGCQGA